MHFRNRAEAGRRLGARLLVSGLAEPAVLGLPRGGVVVAAEVAASFGVPTEVFVVRKLGHPDQPELGLGAIAEGCPPSLDDWAIRRCGLTPDDLVPVIQRETHELARRVAAYRGDRELPPLMDRDVVLVDDGIATGGTARAALGALRASGPRHLVFAAPVGPADVALPDADEVVLLHAPAHFVAVGRWYEDFTQVSDDEVVRLLASSGRRSR